MFTVLLFIRVYAIWSYNKYIAVFPTVGTVSDSFIGCEITQRKGYLKDWLLCLVLYCSKIS